MARYYARHNLLEDLRTRGAALLAVALIAMFVVAAVTPPRYAEAREWSAAAREALKAGVDIESGKTEVPVMTAPVTRGDIMDTVGATGTLQAVTTVQVGSQVSGNISWLGADFNSIVKKGQVIARLDPSLFEAQVEQAQREPRPVAGEPGEVAERPRAQQGRARRRAAEAHARQSWPRSSLLPQSDSTPRKSRSTRRRPRCSRSRPR